MTLELGSPSEQGPLNGCFYKLCVLSTESPFKEVQVGKGAE